MRINTLICIVFVPIIVSCSPKKATSNFTKTSKSKETFYLRFGNPTTFDPTKATDPDTPLIFYQIYEGLVKFNQYNRIEPSLAKSWEISPDRKTYSFELQQGISFHNGKQLTSEDVKWSLERACNPKLASPHAQRLLGDILGVQEKLAGYTQNIRGIEIITPYKVKITLQKPSPTFLYKLTHLVASILPKHPYHDVEITDPTQVIGTGPYKIKSFHNNQTLILIAYDKYHGGKPRTNTIQATVVKDPQTAYNLFQANKLDLSRVAEAQVTSLKENTLGKICPIELAGIYYFELNPSAYKPFRDIKIRQAIAMSIDKQHLIRNIMKDTVDLAYSMVHPSVPGFRTNIQNIKFDPKGARKLLASTKYKHGSKLPPLNMYVRDRSASKLASENAALQLRKNLGLCVSVVEIETSIFQQKLLKKTIPFRLGFHLIDYPDPSCALTDYYTTSSKLNASGYSNPDFDRICTQASNTSNSAERMDLYAQAEDILLKDTIVIPLYYPCYYWMLSPSTKGVRWNAYQGFMPFNWVEKY